MPPNCRADPIDVENANQGEEKLVVPREDAKTASRIERQKQSGGSRAALSLVPASQQDPL